MILLNQKGDIYEASRFEDNEEHDYLQQTEADLHKECNWQFLNKDGSEATFQDQTPKTQSSIAKLLGYENK